MVLFLFNQTKFRPGSGSFLRLELVKSDDAYLGAALADFVVGDNSHTSK